MDFKKIEPRKLPNINELANQFAGRYGIELTKGQKDAINALSTSYPGVIIQGKIGCGKSTVMKIWFEATRQMCNANMMYLTAREFLAMYGTDGEELFLQMKNIEILCLDDIGTEQPMVNSYGTKYDPISELLQFRYDAWEFKRFRTYLTTNLDAGMRQKRYGERLNDRFKKMFNTVTFKGESKR
jgi:DNA replication protein DnaC